MDLGYSVGVEEDRENNPPVKVRWVRESPLDKHYTGAGSKAGQMISGREIGSGLDTQVVRD